MSYDARTEYLVIKQRAWPGFAAALPGETTYRIATFVLAGMLRDGELIAEKRMAWGDRREVYLIRSHRTKALLRLTLMHTEKLSSRGDRKLVFLEDCVQVEAGA